MFRLASRSVPGSSRCIHASFSQSLNRSVNQSVQISWCQIPQKTSYRSFHSSLISFARPPYNTPRQPVSQSASSPTPPEQPIDVSKLPEIYSYDRSTTWRLLTLGSAVLLVVWMPLTYMSLTTDVLPLWQTALGPITSVAIMIMTHYKAQKTISALHYLDPNRYVVTVHNALGQPRSFPMKFIDTQLSSHPYQKTKKVDSSIWILRFPGDKTFSVLDKKGKITDLNSMRRLVGDDDVFHTQS